MKITTSKGKTLEAVWAWGPVQMTGDFLMEMKDERPLSQIAADLEGCETIRKEEIGSVYTTYEGYTNLRSISREKDGMVRVTLSKP